MTLSCYLDGSDSFQRKLNLHVAKDENFFIVFPQGFSKHAPVSVCLTFTKGAFRVEKHPASDITGTVLVVSDQRFEVREQVTTGIGEFSTATNLHSRWKCMRMQALSPSRPRRFRYCSYIICCRICRCYLLFSGLAILCTCVHFVPNLGPPIAFCSACNIYCKVCFLLESNVHTY